MPNKVIHFEIHAEDPERAIRFYSHVFGWQFPKWLEEPEYWGVLTGAEQVTGAGINGGLMRRKGPAPADGAPVNAFVCTVQVDDIDEIHQKVLEAGGTVGVPKHEIPGVGWQAYFKDTEGNIFGVHQPLESA